MKFSVSYVSEGDFTFPFVMRGSYVTAIKKAAQLGYKAVEIHVRDPQELDVEGIWRVCQGEGILISTLGTGLGYVIDGLSITDPDSQIRAKATRRLLEHIEVASYLKAGVIIGSIRGRVPKGEEFLKYEGYVLEAITACLEKAKECGVTLFLEAINRYETNLINTAAEGLKFISKFESELQKYLKLHLDTFHMNIEEANLLQSIRQAGKLLGHIHFADSNRLRPGLGHIDFKAILSTLREVDYSGYIAFEYLPYPEPERAAEEGLCYVRGLLEEI